MPTVSIRDKYFKYNGVKYFRVGSQRVVLGTCGHKRRPLLEGNFLENFVNMSTRYFTDVNSVVVEIEYEDSPAFDLGVNVKVPGFREICGNLTREVMRDMNLKLLNISVGNKQIIDSINKLTDVKRDFFKVEKLLCKQRRVVNEVFTVVSAEIAEALTAQSTAEISGTIKGVEISLSPSASIQQSSVIKLEEGSTFAYLLFKPLWNANAYRNIETVVNGRHDQWGFS